MLRASTLPAVAASLPAAVGVGSSATTAPRRQAPRAAAVSRKASPQATSRPLASRAASLNKRDAAPPLQALRTEQPVMALSSGVDVTVVLGSRSDLPVAEKCIKILEQFGVTYQLRVASAHRAPVYLEGIITSAEAQGCKVFIGMAGVAAALPGVIASMTGKPVIGVPCGGKVPYDSLLSIVQMPPGMPVATVGTDRGDNAGVLAVQILAAFDATLAQNFKDYRTRMTNNVIADDQLTVKEYPTSGNGLSGSAPAAQSGAPSGSSFVESSRGADPVLEAKIMDAVVYKKALTEVDLRVGELIRKGKVRDVYDSGDFIISVTSDRQSAFDRMLCQVPFKGQVLNQTTVWWFNNTKHIIDNAFVASPHPYATVMKKAEVFPVEFVMRGYLTGSTETSILTLYKNGCRNYCGNPLPDGMVPSQKLPENILTPTTKGVRDIPIDLQGIVSEGLMSSADLWVCANAAKELFAFGQAEAAKRGLILVDTKYEFGKLADGTIVLIDEVHTPDSSRYWVASTYDERMAAGMNPENIDKEFLRLWFRDNCDPYKDEVLPEAPAELVAELSRRYILLYETITGEKMQFADDFSAGPDSNMANAIRNTMASLNYS